SSWRLHNRSFSNRNNLSDPLAVISYTVNTPWLFDQMWCLGVAYVTTNHIEMLSNMSEPTFYLLRSNYIVLVIVWELIFGLSLLLISGITYRYISGNLIDFEEKEVEIGLGKDYHE